MNHDTVPLDHVPAKRRSTRRSDWDRFLDAIHLPTLVWLVHFLIVQVVAYVSYRYGSIRSVEWNWASLSFDQKNGEVSGAYQMVRPPLDGWMHWIVEPFRQWDGTWYSLIAEKGYSEQFSATAAFFPLYPWLMESGHKLTGLPVETVGWLVSNLAFLGGLIVTYLLLKMDFNEKVARWSIIAIAIFPTAFFFSAVYTESLFFFLAVLTLWAARRNDWLLAVIACLFAVLTRSAGMMLGFPLLVLFVQQHGWNVGKWFPKALLAIVPLIGLLVFGRTLENNGLDKLDWQDQQWQWNRFSAMPWKTFDCVLNGCHPTVRGFGSTYETDVHPVSFRFLRMFFDDPSWATLTSSEFRYWVGQSQVMDVFVTFLALGLIVIGLRKLPLYYSAWTIPPMLVPLFAPSSVFPLMSMPRFVLPLVPLFVMAVLLLQRWPRVAYALGGISVLLLIIQTSQFALWYWVS